MFENLGREFFRAIRQAIWRISRGFLIGLVLGALAAEVAGYFIVGGWPPHTFVNIAAIAFAVVMGYGVAVTTALVEGVRGLIRAASQIDDVAKAAANTGLNVVDAMVDAVDGPNRHGIR